MWVASLADAGVASQADISDSIAGRVMDLTVQVRVRTEEMIFQQEGVVRNRSVSNGSVYGDSEMDCGDCASPIAWCQEMPEICDNSNCQYINFVGCDPHCVDRTVLEGGEKEKIEAMSGTIYDYDDVIDNQPGYFDYDDPCDYGEWCAWDVPGEGGTCSDPYQSDLTDGETVFSRVWSGVRSDGAVARPRRCQTSQVTLRKRLERSCLGPVNRSPGIFSSRIWTPRCRTLPELQTNRPRRCRTSYVTLIKRPELPSQGPVNRSQGY